MLLVLNVPAVPVYAATVATLKFSTANLVTLSRKVLKSRASTVPVIVRFVTLDFSVAVNAAPRPPAEILTVLETCAFDIKEMHRRTESKISFISIVN